MPDPTALYYDEQTLSTARGYGQPYVYQGVAANREWVARADPHIALDFGQDGQPVGTGDLDARREAQRTLQLARELLDDAQVYVSQHPEALDRLRRESDPGRFMGRPQLVDEQTGFTIKLRDYHFANLIGAADRLAAAFWGRNFCVLVVRHATAMAVIHGGLTVRDLQAPVTDTGRLQQWAANVRLRVALPQIRQTLAKSRPI
jgi:hypothetical protein